MDDSVSRQAVLNLIEESNSDWYEIGWIYDNVKRLPSAQPEPLTDNEKRIFLAAMDREENVCREVDKVNRYCKEPYEDSLVWICHEIVRKVKATLWG